MTDRERITYFKSIFSKDLMEDWIDMLKKSLASICQEKFDDLKTFRHNNPNFDNHEINDVYIIFNDVFFALYKYLSKFDYNKLALGYYLKENKFWELLALLEDAHLQLLRTFGNDQSDKIGMNDETISQHLVQQQVKLIFNRKDFRLYRGDDPKRCYKFRRGDRIKILDILILLNGERIHTKHIATKLETNQKAIRAQIGALNSSFRKKFKLDKDVQVIEGTESLGYRINPDFKIEL